MKPKLIVLVGPPGSGKSKYALDLAESAVEVTQYINQDKQGKILHLTLFKDALALGFDIIVDRMNFSKEQRNRYIEPARKAGYEIEIVVFHAPRRVCFDRIMNRGNHATINGLIDAPNGYDQEPQFYSVEEKQRQANSALDTFFTKYDRVEDTEADKVIRLGQDGSAPAVIIDLDGTLCNIDHRLHYVQGEGKKQWDLFFKEVPNDSVNEWCHQIVKRFNDFPVLFCSGRGDQTRRDTETWLNKQGLPLDYNHNYRQLFMRHRNDFRQDYVVKEIILDFEILTRYKVLFAIDDRKQVVDLWRRRGITCLACAEGEF